MPCAPAVSPAFAVTSITRPANGARTNARSYSACRLATSCSATAIRESATVAFARRALQEAALASAAPRNWSAMSSEVSLRASSSFCRFD